MEVSGRVPAAVRVALTAGGACFLAGELVGMAALVGGAASEAGDLALTLGIHGGESARGAARGS